MAPRPCSGQAAGVEDAYTLSGGAEAPPASIPSALKRIGPGIVLASAIVGSGEVIATTTLGAQVGYSALWIVLVSCAIKPVVQAELGRYTVVTGHTGLEGFTRVPGPRLGASWLVWAWAITVMLTLLQVGGMYGGVGQVLHTVVPRIAVNAWVGICLGITLAVLLGGGYARIERFAVFKVALFTVITVCAAVVLLRTPGAVSGAEFASGLSFALPASGLATAMAVFGITGVGATELAMYPYWCVEKGYARYVGPRDGTAEWTRRARGWIRVMHLDITCSLAIYTMATIAFYLLGAGVLHSMGVVPAAKDTVAVLSNIYTQTLGGWALPLFYVGVVVTLYGTIFAATAAHSRMMADLACITGAYTREDAGRRLHWRRVFVVVLATLPAIFYWFFESPVRMVVAGGIAQAMMLPLLGGAAIYLRHTQLPRDLEPSVGTTLALWSCTLVMLAFALYYLATALVS